MSSGYHRLGANVRGASLGWDNRSPQSSRSDLGGTESNGTVPIVVGSMTLTAQSPDPTKLNSIPIVFGELSLPPDPTTLGGQKLDVDQARGQGYTGDSCSHCGGMRMRRNGTCMVCDDCGTTTGCS